MKRLFNQLYYLVDLKYSPIGSQHGDLEKLLDLGLWHMGSIAVRLWESHLTSLENLYNDSS